MMIRVALYARVSTERQAEQGYGLSAQLDVTRAAARKRGYEIVGEYVDDGYSGASPNRPELIRLLADAKAKAFDVVLASTGSRIARDAHLKEGIRRELRKHKVRMEYVDVAFDDTPMGKAYEQIGDVFEQLQKVMQLAAMNGGRYAKARKGMLVSPGNTPYGYEPDPDS